jgi:DNA polymerase-3 subunit gamma/tau
MRKAELKDGVRADPLVQAVLQRFPGAEIVDVRQPGSTPVAGAEEVPDIAQNDSDIADDEA